MITAFTEEHNSAKLNQWTADSLLFVLQYGAYILIILEHYITKNIYLGPQNWGGPAL